MVLVELSSSQAEGVVAASTAELGGSWIEESVHKPNRTWLSAHLQVDVGSKCRSRAT